MYLKKTKVLRHFHGVGVTCSKQGAVEDGATDAVLVECSRTSESEDQRPLPEPLCVDWIEGAASGLVRERCSGLPLLCCCRTFG